MEDESKDDPSFFIVTYSETVTDGVDYEVPDDREVENPTGRLMVTMDLRTSWGEVSPVRYVVKDS